MDKESDRNYENLTKLKKYLLEYKVYKEYEYIVKDMKELFTHKEEYKDIMANKLKEIAAKEKELFAINKKINSEGIYKIKFLTLKKDKLADAKLERNKIITELIGLYDELDNEKIKEFIYRNVDSETNCYDLLKFATFNYNYFVSLLKKDNPDIGLDEIKDKMLKLQMFIYDNTLDIINNINVTEEKEIDKIICEKFKLNNINIEPEKLEEDLIDKTIEDVDMLLVSYDVERVGLDLNDIKFHIEADDTLK